MPETENKKVDRKHFTITETQYLKRRLSKSKHPKWKLKVAKWLDIEPAEQWQFMTKVKYKGSVRLKKGDVVCSKQQGVFFAVVEELNRMATLVNIYPSLDKHQMHGMFYLIEDPKTVGNLNKNN